MWVLLLPPIFLPHVSLSLSLSLSLTCDAFINWQEGQKKRCFIVNYWRGFSSFLGKKGRVGVLEGGRKVTGSRIYDLKNWLNLIGQKNSRWRAQPFPQIATASPTTNGAWYAKRKLSWNTYVHIPHTFFFHFCMLSQCLSTKNFCIGAQEEV